MSKENVWKKVGDSVSIEEKDEVEEIKERWSSGFNALLKEGYIFLTGQAIKDIDFLLSSLEKEKQSHVMSVYDLSMKIAEVGIALEKEKEENERLNRVYNLELERVNKAENKHFQVLLELQKEKERADRWQNDWEKLNAHLSTKLHEIISLKERGEELEIEKENLQSHIDLSGTQIYRLTERIRELENSLIEVNKNWMEEYEKKGERMLMEKLNGWKINIKKQ